MIAHGPFHPSRPPDPSISCPLGTRTRTASHLSEPCQTHPPPPIAAHLKTIPVCPFRKPRWRTQGYNPRTKLWSAFPATTTPHISPDTHEVVRISPIGHTPPALAEPPPLSTLASGHHPSRLSRFSVLIRLLDGSVHSVTVSYFTTGSVLLSSLSACFPLPQHVYLSAGGRPIYPSRTLYDLNIAPVSTIDVLARICGGAPADLHPRPGRRLHHPQQLPPFSRPSSLHRKPPRRCLSPFANQKRYTRRYTIPPPSTKGSQRHLKPLAPLLEMPCPSCALPSRMHLRGASLSLASRLCVPADQVQLLLHMWLTTTLGWLAPARSSPHEDDLSRLLCTLHILHSQATTLPDVNTSDTSPYLSQPPCAVDPQVAARGVGPTGYVTIPPDIWLSAAPGGLLLADARTPPHKPSNCPILQQMLDALLAAGLVAIHPGLPNAEAFVK